MFDLILLQQTFLRLSMVSHPPPACVLPAQAHGIELQIEIYTHETTVTMALMLYTAFLQGYTVILTHPGGPINSVHDKINCNLV